MSVPPSPEEHAAFVWEGSGERSRAVSRRALTGAEQSLPCNWRAFRPYIPRGGLERAEEDAERQDGGGKSGARLFCL